MLLKNLFKRRCLWGAGAAVVMSAIVVVYCFFVKKESADHWATRQVRYSFTFQNKTNRVIENARFLVRAPLSQTGAQRCRSITASHDHQILPSVSSHQILQFSFPVFPPYATKVIRVDADVSLAERPAGTEPDPGRSHLEPERYIESDHPEIKALARQLTRKNDMATVRSILDWVSRRIQYTGYRDDARGALWTLRHKSGDCTEFAHLFTALCRAANVPSRTVGGYVCKSDQTLHASDYHDWAEVLIRNRWILADPQRNVFDSHYQEYIAMHRHGGDGDHGMGGFYRFRIDGNGLKARMN